MELEELNNPKLQYVLQYAQKYYPDIDFDEETGESVFYPSQTLLSYIRFHDVILECLPSNFTKENFNNDKHIPALLNKFNIDHEAFWEFLVFIFHLYKQYYTLRQAKATNRLIDNPYPIDTPLIAVYEELYALSLFLSAGSNNTRIVIKRGKGFDSVEIKDRKFIEEICNLFMADNIHPYHVAKPEIIEALKSYGEMIKDNLAKTKLEFINGRKKHILMYTAAIQEISNILISGKQTSSNGLLIHSCISNTKESLLEYCILKAIYDEIITRPQGIEFTEDEKILYLSVLNLCGFKHQPVNKKRGIAIYQLFQQYKGYNVRIPCTNQIFDLGTECAFQKQQ